MTKNKISYNFAFYIDFATEFDFYVFSCLADILESFKSNTTKYHVPWFRI